MRKAMYMCGAIFNTILEEVLPPFAKIMFKRLSTPEDAYLIRRLRNKKKQTNNIQLPDIEIPLEKRSVVHLTDFILNEEGFTEGIFYLEEHNASHLHNDFSIILNGKVYRVARTPSESNKKGGFLDLFPGPGEKVQWHLQPEHLVSEVPNPKIILEGYGKGTTKVITKGTCLAHRSADGHMTIMFEGIDGAYGLIEKDNSVLMIRKQNKGGWISKHNMKDKQDISPFIKNPSITLFTKLDGAAVEWRVVEKGGYKRLQIFSWRPDALLNKNFNKHNQIDHTWRLELCDKIISNDIPISAGRGELWCKGKDGLLHINAILNSLPIRSRKLNKNPALYIHDIVEWNGKNIEASPYIEKMTLINQLNKIDKRFNPIEYATTPTEKRILWNKCRKADSVDGVIAMDINKINTIRTKIKFKHHEENWHAATIVDFQPQTGKNNTTMAYPILENKHGVRFTSSGVGVNDKLKTDMMSNPQNYLGKEVLYSAERHFDNNLPFQPIIKKI